MMGEAEDGGGDDDDDWSREFRWLDSLSRRVAENARAALAKQHVRTETLPALHVHAHRFHGVVRVHDELFVIALATAMVQFVRA
ncbi:hypothetical protein ACLOJK_019850 [Asimina triloba]